MRSLLSSTGLERLLGISKVFIVYLSDRYYTSLSVPSLILQACDRKSSPRRRETIDYVRRPQRG
jgi:hypothetical protein